MTVVIINYGMGNLRSIQYKLEKEGIRSIISCDKKQVTEADILLLPGVGHFRQGMQNLKSLGLIDVLNKKVIGDRTPVMGICLGIQLFTKWSEEGNVEGLGWIDADTKKFNFEGMARHLRIPHIGWNSLKKKREHVFLEGIENERKFYFVHSYHLCCRDQEDVLTTTLYGYEFVSSIQRDNIFGTQFHPEKSHRKGVEIIVNFIRHYKNE